MGVPKLWSYVARRNLSERKEFHIRKESEKRSGEKLFDDGFGVTHLIFDAPSFAYWFWREAHLGQGTIFIPRFSLTVLEEYFRYSQLLGVFIHDLINNGNFKLYIPRNRSGLTLVRFYLMVVCPLGNSLYEKGDTNYSSQRLSIIPKENPINVLPRHS
jgi:hypothetical protein